MRRNFQPVMLAAMLWLLSACGTALAEEPTLSQQPPLKTSESMRRLDQSVRLLFDEYLRDPSICLGPDGSYYLTGTSEGQNSIRIWKSSDLKKWEPLAFSWTYGESPWH
jgi:beta-xylosidase